jgi:inorganic triphosphatase YgiF
MQMPANSPSETEIKLLSSPATIARLRDHPRLCGTDADARLETIYFDSEDRRLRRAGISLRVRRDGVDCEQTLKTADGGGGIRRGEWTTPIEDEQPLLAALPRDGRNTVHQALDGADLAPVAASRINRTTRLLREGRSTIAVAFDEGNLESGSQSEPVSELELELVDGELVDVLKLVLDLPVGPDLRWSITSKLQRAAQLSSDTPPAAVKAEAPSLSPSMDVASAFRVIAWNCLEQLLANYPLIIASDNDEAVHQARVAIRRLRAACKLFGDVVADDEQPVLLAGIKAVGGELGDARDLYVLRNRLREPAEEAGGDFQPLLEHIAARQAEAMEVARTVVSGEPFQRLLFELANWIEGDSWLENADTDKGDDRLLAYSRRLLAKLRRKLHPKGTLLSDMSDHALHELRIRAKKLRYAVEFFETLSNDPRADEDRKEFLTALKELQDDLGDVHDIAVAGERRDALFSDLEQITAAEMAAQFDLLEAATARRRGKLIKSSQKALDRIIDAPPWWKVT